MRRVSAAWRFVKTCVRAAKYLRTVRRAVPWYAWPILAIGTAIKMLPVDFEIDEALYLLAALLIAWRRPRLLKALYREAQAGRQAGAVLMCALQQAEPGGVGGAERVPLQRGSGRIPGGNPRRRA